MLGVVQADATQDGDIRRRQGAEQLLDGHNLVGHLGGAGGVVDLALDDIGLETGLLGGLAEIKVRGGQDGLPKEGPPVGGDEADETFPGDLHGGVVCGFVKGIEIL